MGKELPGEARSNRQTKQASRMSCCPSSRSKTHAGPSILLRRPTDTRTFLPTTQAPRLNFVQQKHRRLDAPRAPERLIERYVYTRRAETAVPDVSLAQ